MDQDIDSEIDLDFQEIPEGMAGLRKAFYEQNGFDRLSKTVVGTVSLSFKFKNGDLKAKYKEALMNSENPHLEEFSMYGFGDNSNLTASVEYEGTMHSAFEVVASLDRIKELGDEYIIEREPNSKEDITFDPQKDYEDEQIVRCFYEWVHVRMSSTI